MKILTSEVLSNGFIAIYGDNRKWGLTDICKNKILQCRYDCILDFNYGFSNVLLNGKWGTIDTFGNKIIPCKYNNCYNFNSNGLCAFYLNGSWGFIDIANPNKWIKFNPIIVIIGNLDDIVYQLKYTDTYIIKVGKFIGNLKEFEEYVKSQYSKKDKHYKPYMKVIEDLKKTL